MKKVFLLSLSILIGAVNAFSQTSIPKPTPPKDDDVVKITTQLIQVDVSVTDSKGKAVADLKPNEIEIYENGQKQKITHFSFVSSVRDENSSMATSKPIAKLVLPVPVSQASIRPEQVHRTITMVVDDLSLSFESIHFTKLALKKFIAEQMQDGDLVSIIMTGRSIGTLQQFTSNKQILHAAIDKIRYNLMGTGTMTGLAPVGATPLEKLRATGHPGITGGQIQDEKRQLNSIADSNKGVLVTGTFGTLQYVTNGMRDMPGRKSVLFFSDGFRLYERNRTGIQTSRIVDALNRLIEIANRASVVFYAIDPRGLQYTGLTAADDLPSKTPRAVNVKLSERRDELEQTQAGLSYLAEGTGGIAFKNQNDISLGVRRVLDDQSYYLIAYVPDSDTFDPAKRKFNKFEVKVKRPGLTARYRSGFFNTPGRSPGLARTDLTPIEQLGAAIASPFVENGIGLRLNALFGNDAANGSYVTSLLHIDGGDMKFTDRDDGTKQAEFEVLAVSYGDSGQPVDHLARGYKVSFAANDVARFVSNGFVYRFTFPVKTPGSYQYRVAIRDSQGGKIGSASQFINVPDLQNRQLALSGIWLENMSTEQYRKLMDPTRGVVNTDPAGDTSLRRFKAGTVLRYSFDILNAKSVDAKSPSLRVKVRLICDGKLVFDGEQSAVDMTGQTDLEHIKFERAMVLGTDMPRGEYILQTMVTDDRAKPNEQLASQFVQFEVVD